MGGNSILQAAFSYLENKDRLIYSYHGNTFLQGGELYDHVHDGRGRIDCSTLVHLALQGISYDMSPYVTGDPGTFLRSTCTWRAGACRTISDVFAERADRATDIRRAYGLAKYCRENGLELSSDPVHLEKSPADCIMPGDLVFFEAGRSVYKEYVKYGAYLAISHVGIVTDDTEVMINATGRSDEKYNAENDAVRLTRITDKGTPVMIARIAQVD